MANISIKEPRKIELSFEKRTTGNGLCKIKMKDRQVSIPAGTYRLVYGVPRKFWPAPTPKGGIVFVENYEYELEKVVTGGFLQNLRKDYAKLGWDYRESLEIKGQFDPDGACWKQGAEALFLDPVTGVTLTVGLPQWRFTLYEGDLLYNSLGKLIFNTNES